MDKEPFCVPKYSFYVLQNERDQSCFHQRVRSLSKQKGAVFKEQLFHHHKYSCAFKKICACLKGQSLPLQVDLHSLIYCWGVLTTDKNEKQNMTVFKQLILNNLRGFQMKVAPKTMTFCFCHQVVWNSSYKVGCGVAFCRNSTYFYGCHYYRAYVTLIYPPWLCFTCYFSESLTVVSVYLTRGWFRVKLIWVKKTICLTEETLRDGNLMRLDPRVLPVPITVKTNSAVSNRYDDKYTLRVICVATMNDNKANPFIVLSILCFRQPLSLHKPLLKLPSIESFFWMQQ